MSKSFRIALLIMPLWLMPLGSAYAEGLLDGRGFEGKIGPAENPDLADRLLFADGHFWSDICTRCGFLPGRYSSEKTEEGIRFSGMLESDSRGQFTYDGVVGDDGKIEVSIQWERRRWYWISRREIAFHGKESKTIESSLTRIRAEINDIDPSANPMCARF